MRVAVVKNELGRTGSVFLDKTVDIYEEKGGFWKTAVTLQNPVPASESEENIGLASENFAQILADYNCVALVAKTSGVVFRAMESHGIRIFTRSGSFCGYPTEFLNQVREAFDKLHADQQWAAQRPALLSLFQPCDSELHAFEINLIDAMNQYPEMNTREIIFPFFEKVPFERLYILCDHLPHWLEDTIPVLEYTFASQRTEDGSAFEVCVDNPMGLNEVKKALNCGGCNGCG